MLDNINVTGDNNNVRENAIYDFPNSYTCNPVLRNKRARKISAPGLPEFHCYLVDHRVLVIKRQR